MIPIRGLISSPRTCISRFERLTFIRKYIHIPRVGAVESKSSSDEVSKRSQAIQDDVASRGEKGSIQASIHAIEAKLSSDDVSNRIQAMFEAIHDDVARRGQNPFDALRNNFGFTFRKAPSTIPQAGFGLFLDGKAPSASVVAIYPGVLYHSGDPSFFPSLRNSYIIKRMDGSCVDGKYWGLSRYMYTSLAERDGPTPIFDNTWHLVADKNWRDKLRSPLAMGQMINNANGEPNVMYYEFEFSAKIPRHLWYMIPNINYRGTSALYGDDDVDLRTNCLVKSIAMVTLRDVEDEELFSNYSWVGLPQIK